MSKIMMITPQMHFSVFPHIILGHPPFTLPERHPGYFTTTLMQPISNVCQLLFPKPQVRETPWSGGKWLPSHNTPFLLWQQDLPILGQGGEKGGESQHLLGLCVIWGFLFVLLNCLCAHLPLVLAPLVPTVGAPV